MDIKEMSRDALAAWLAERGIRSFRAEQIFRWIYQGQADGFDGMTDLGKTLRADLDRHFTNRRLTVADRAGSADGTVKYLFELADGAHIESVRIPERDHYTLCISSQVGCALGCRFCMTGRSGLTRNLTAAEIAGQVRDIAHLLPADDPRRLTNIVLMGMGEPLANYESVTTAIAALTDAKAGMGISSRRITLSTAGLVPMLQRLGKETSVKLAISLNAADNATRDRLMPINRTYPIERLLEACRRYPLKPGRRITVEYILIKGVNDAVADARRLAKLLHPIRAKVNLIPFNPHPGCEYQRPGESEILRFQEILVQKNYTTIIRRSKGQDIAAACGQLRGTRSPHHD